MKIGGFNGYYFLSKVLLTETFHLFSVVKGALSVGSWMQIASGRSDSVFLGGKKCNFIETHLQFSEVYDNNTISR